jgi:hypothetical protein
MNVTDWVSIVVSGLSMLVGTLFILVVGYNLGDKKNVP